MPKTLRNNVFRGVFLLGNQPLTRAGTLDDRRMYEEAKGILKRINLKVSLKKLVADLSVAQLQTVEIGRALTRQSKVIIMDQPTSSLTDSEKDTLHDLIGKLREEGGSVIYISHKLEDVLEISDRITVLRDGEKIITLDAIEGKDAYQVLVHDYCNADRTTAQTMTENYITGFDNLDTVVCFSDNFAIGSINALQAANKLDSIDVLSIDGMRTSPARTPCGSSSISDPSSRRRIERLLRF